MSKQNNAERPYYSRKIFMQVVKHRGYMTERAVIDALVPVLEMTKKRVSFRVRTGRWSVEQMFVIAAYFEMTPKEFYDSFMHGLFIADREGHYVCKVDAENRHTLLASDNVYKPQPTAAQKRAEIERVLDSLREFDLESEV